jgi:hypothetical protein
MGPIQRKLEQLGWALKLLPPRWITILVDAISQPPMRSRTSLVPAAITW